MPSGSAAPGREDYNEYVEFFDVLGITDAVKVSYLSTLLRLFYEAATKLDMHLAPHGASLHSAVSRIITSANPTEAPRHRWIRVVDRLGFFTDKDLHAQRVVNVGLSYAYRNLQLNALTEDNALLLQSRSTGRTAPRTNGTPGGEHVPLGGVEVTRRDVGQRGVAAMPEVASLAPLDTSRPGAQDPHLGTASLVGATDEVPCTGGSVIRGATDGGLPTAGALSPAGTPCKAMRSDGGPAVAPGGLVIIDRTRPPPPLSTGGNPPTSVTSGAERAFQAAQGQGSGHPAFDASVGQDPVAGDPSMGCGDEEEEPCQSAGDGGASDSQGVGANPMTNFENQPTVIPLPSAVGFVLAAMQSIKEVEDATEVMRSLLNDSLITTARVWKACRRSNVGDRRKRTEWGDVFDLMAQWWPVWNAPVDAPAGMPPDGTFAAKDNATRACRSSRWRVRVDMSGVNDMLKKLSTRSHRYFPKNALSSHETVGRYSASTKLRLPVTAAMMLLVASKDENFGPILGNLASGGRPNAPRAAPLATATYHDFAASTTGATVSAALDALPTTPNAPPLSSSSPVTVNPRPPSEVLELAGPVAQFPNELFEKMDELLDKERIGEVAQNRAARIAARRASGRPPLPRAGGQAPDEGPSSSAPGNSTSSPSNASALQGAGKRKTATPGRSPSPPTKRRAAATARGGRGGRALSTSGKVRGAGSGGGAREAGGERGGGGPAVDCGLGGGTPRASGDSVLVPGMGTAGDGLRNGLLNASDASNGDGGGGRVGRETEASALMAVGTTGDGDTVLPAGLGDGDGASAETLATETTVPIADEGSVPVVAAVHSDGACAIGGSRDVGLGELWQSKG